MCGNIGAFNFLMIGLGTSMIYIDILNILRTVNGRSPLLFSFLTSVENHHVKSNI